MSFSATADDGSKRAQIFESLLETAKDIKDHNYRSYFVRRVTEDMQATDKQTESIEELQERLEQL